MKGMTRAEEAANKAYPVDDNSVFNYAVNLGFVEGYEQAEKDLALTADDVGRIHNLIRKTQIKYNATVACYPEVAECFNNERK